MRRVEGSGTFAVDRPDGGGGLRLHGERRGDGPPLLFLNGSGTTLDTARPILSRLAATFDVASFDYRGMGLSGLPDTPYAMADVAADAVAVADHLGWDRPRVLGVSFGGMVAQELAVTHPDRVARLALACTSPGGAGGASYPLHTLAGLDPDRRAAVQLRILDTRFSPEWLATHPSDRALVEMMAGRPTAATAEAARGVELQMAARAGFDAYDRLGRIACPTLVASGRFDGIAPPANGAALAAAIGGAEFRQFDGGHMFFLQDPTAWPAVVSFLSS